MLSMQKIMLQPLMYTIHCSGWTEASHPALECCRTTWGTWVLSMCRVMDGDEIFVCDRTPCRKDWSLLSPALMLPYTVTFHFEPQQGQKTEEGRYAVTSVIQMLTAQMEVWTWS